MNKLAYGELPLNIRLLYILIGISGASAILLAFVKMGVNISTKNNMYLSFGLAIMAMLSPMKSLRFRNRKKLLKAILFLIAVPLYYFTIIIMEGSFYAESRNLVFWWPLVNSILFILCAMALINKRTFNFYNKSV